MHDDDVFMMHCLCLTCINIYKEQQEKDSNKFLRGVIVVKSCKFDLKFAGLLPTLQMVFIIRFCMNHTIKNVLCVDVRISYLASL